MQSEALTKCGFEPAIFTVSALKFYTLTIVPARFLGETVLLHALQWRIKARHKLEKNK